MMVLIIVSFSVSCEKLKKEYINKIMVNNNPIIE